MTTTKETRHRPDPGKHAPRGAAAEIRTMLAEGGLSAAHGLEWLLDHLDRRAEAGA